MAEDAIWVLADPRAGTAAQALGIAERLGRPFRTIDLAWGPWARIPWPWPTLAGLTTALRATIAPPWPRLVISAGRRSAPVALWLGRRGARTVHCMRPGFGAPGFDLLVLGQHDAPAAAPNILPILGATHRISPAVLDTARAAWGATLGALPGPRIALLVGGPVRAEGMDPGVAGRIARDAAALGASVMATTSRRTGAAATRAVAEALQATPHHLHAWGDAGPNPYRGYLAWADAVVVTGDSVSMLSEALMAPGPVLIADPGGLGLRHHALHRSLIAAGAAAMLGAPAPPDRTPRDETARVAAAVARRFPG